MEFLPQQNRRIGREPIVSNDPILASSKHVVVIGGGDTGSDCAGTALRQGAKSVQQVEILARPPDRRARSTPWPLWPSMLRSSHAHAEGCERDWGVRTLAFRGNGRVGFVVAERVTWEKGPDGRPTPVHVPGSEFDIEADLVLLALGFTGPATGGLVTDLGAALDGRACLATDRLHRTSVPRVFAAGDARRGASLVVWAIREGRDAAASIDDFLRTGNG
jgi:glutamate synthase (NADPH/NADH) small chain